jgi:serine protease Do
MFRSLKEIPMSQSRPSRLATIVATAGITAAAVAAGSAGAFDLPHIFGGSVASTATAASAAAAAPAPVPALPPGATPDYRAIVKQAGPAVVGVTVAGTHTPDAEDEGVSQQGLPPDMENDPFFQFFRGMPGFQRGQRGQRGQAPQGVPFRGQGSGFIISSDGLILTNAHVVREAKDVTVKLSDRREFKAKVLGSDPVTDVAVLRIDAKNLPVVRLGDPSQAQVGDRVLAIGAPYGLEQTATQGIVSAKGRSLPGDSAVPFIQTDAAVNPGNSGGPLFDGTGAVIGINAQIYSRSGGFQGLSFAIPIDVALNVKNQIVATGSARHGRLGVMVQDVNQALAESFGMARPDGALIAKVEKSSAAAQAGLKAGDVITAVNGQKVTQAGSLSSLIALAAPGDTIKLNVWRDKSDKTVDAKLGSATPEKDAAAGKDSADDNAKLGLALRPLNREEQRDIGSNKGMVIEDVAGAAERAGVQSGDVLLAINGKPVQSVEEVRAALKSHPKQVALLLMRDGDTLFVPVPLS